jgi:hypothetical protein
MPSLVRNATDSLSIVEAAHVTGGASGYKVASSAISNSIGFTQAISGEKIETPSIDRRGALIAAVTGVGTGGAVGEHTLQGPWLLRWGFGAAVGGALVAWLWDALRPR